MATLSQANHDTNPPRIHIPREYNAAYDLIERNLLAGRAGKTVYIDDAGRYSYGELAERVNRCANALTLPIGKMLPVTPSVTRSGPHPT